MNMPLWPQTYHFGSFLVILRHFGHTGHSGHFGQYWPILANIAEIHKMAILFSTFFRKKSYDKENDVFFNLEPFVKTFFLSTQFFRVKIGENAFSNHTGKHWKFSDRNVHL